MNTLCDSCLQLGFALQLPRVTLAIVVEAAGDLDLIPTLATSGPNAEIVPESVPVAQAKPRIMPENIPVTQAKPEIIPESVSVVQLKPNGESNGTAEFRIPLESYANRQKSVGALAWLCCDRWR